MVERGTFTPMDDRESVGDALNSCPYLGLASDPSLSCSFLTSSHRCFRWPTPQPVDYQQQRDYCLSDDFEECDWFVSTLEAPPERRRQSSSWVGYAGLLGVVAAAVLVVGVLVYFKPWAFLLPATSESNRAAAVEAPTVGPAAGATATTAPEPSSQPIALDASPTSLASPTADLPRTAGAASTTAPAVVAPSLRATATPAPRPPTATPVRSATTPAPTPSGASASAAVRVYTVREGDSLYSLARTFGVTVQALMKANNLQETSILKVGQSLVIPPAGR